MYIIGELKYSSLRKGIGYLKLQYNREDITSLIQRAEKTFNVKLKGDDVHVSIVRDEPIPFKKYWNKHKEPIGIQIFCDEIFNDGRFYWVDVSCHYIDLIREELGLKRKTELPLHLTLGQSYKNTINNSKI
jgi:hypothetical protein